MAVLLALPAAAQTTAFTYQGQLGANGSPASGNYDLRFRLFDTNSTLQAGPVTNAPVGVTNGLFITSVDFGDAAFNGNPRLLEIAVRPFGNTNAYTVLTPDQAITSAPYAIQSLNAAALSAPLPATNIAGTLPLINLSTNVALLSSNLVFIGADVFRGALTATNSANVFAGSFSGNGAGLVGLAATNLTGILPDSLLSSNVAMLDATNANFSSNVTAVLYTGSGHGLTNVPGAFFWLTVNGTNAQASSNLGFIVTNNVAPVFINLPPSPAAGDTFRVAGVGAGGWILTQSAGQSVLAGNLADTTGLNWTKQTGSGVENWTGLASSADGTHLIAVATTGVFVSTNSGVSWTQTSTIGSGFIGTSVACSSSGNNVVLTVENTTSVPTTGYIYTSSNGGNTWSQPEEGGAEWIACACSANGNVLVAASHDGYLYTSANGGTSWSGIYSNSVSWTGVAASADGTKLVACFNASGGGYIYTGSGGSWSSSTNSGLHTWSAIASSADGSHLVATATGNTGGIYASANGGATWAVQNQDSVNWTAVASSADGSHLAAVYDGGSVSTPGYLYTSDDSGSTWLQRLGAPNAAWTAVAGSADGSKLAAAVYNGYIYTSGQGSTTTGTNGCLTGGYQSALELQYVGGGVFLPLSHEGTIRAQ